MSFYGSKDYFSGKVIRRYEEELDGTGKDEAVYLGMRGVNTAEDDIRRAVHRIRTQMDAVIERLENGYHMDAFSNGVVQEARDLDAAISARKLNFDFLVHLLGPDEMTRAHKESE